MNKLIITRWKGRTLTALAAPDRVLELGLSEEGSVLGNIYIGRVKKIITNLNSAFVDFGDGRTGYYSMTDNPRPIYAGAHGCRLCEGDPLVVQVARDAVRTKDPVLSANLTFAGKYAVLTAGRRTIGFSAKINDKTWKESLRPQLEELLGEQSGVIVRTEAYRHEEALLREIAALLDEYRDVLARAPYRTAGSLLYQAEPEYLKILKSSPSGTLEAVITDDADIYEQVARYLRKYQAQDIGLLRFYQDPLIGLPALYRLETAIQQARQKRVWLKSGGYLVIETTEAMVVIDVNTGKYTGKKEPEATLRMTNLEAAEEICHQLRLRNLSGIIIVDFIDMKEEADRELLLERLRTLATADPVRLTVVEMTKLGLVEMTRKKVRKPLWEQLLPIDSQKGMET